MTRRRSCSTAAGRCGCAPSRIALIAGLHSQRDLVEVAPDQAPDDRPHHPRTMRCSMTPQLSSLLHRVRSRHGARPMAPGSPVSRTSVPRCVGDTDAAHLPGLRAPWCAVPQRDVVLGAVRSYQDDGARRDRPPARRAGPVMPLRRATRLSARGGLGATEVPTPMVLAARMRKRIAELDGDAMRSCSEPADDFVEQGHSTVSR